MTYVNPGGEYVRIHGLPTGVEDVMRYADFLRQEAGLSDKPPIDLNRIYDRFGIPKPRRADLPNQQGLLLNPDSGLIIINRNDIGTRQRFTEAHELMELVFSQAPGGNTWSARDRSKFKRAEKETLCNLGAAELLMPISSFLPPVELLGVSMMTGDKLARAYRVSPQAALVNMARRGPGLHAVVLWRYLSEPDEIGSTSNGDQKPLFGGSSKPDAESRLRVEWAIGKRRGPYIPKYKTAAADGPIHRAYADLSNTVGEEYMEFSRVHGYVGTENRAFKSGKEKMVMSLLHLPGDGNCIGWLPF